MFFKFSFYFLCFLSFRFIEFVAWLVGSSTQYAIFTTFQGNIENAWLIKVVSLVNKILNELLHCMCF